MTINNTTHKQLKKRKKKAHNYTTTIRYYHSKHLVSIPNSLVFLSSGPTEYNITGLSIFRVDLVTYSCFVPYTIVGFKVDLTANRKYIYSSNTLHISLNKYNLHPLLLPSSSIDRREVGGLVEEDECIDQNIISF